MFLYHFLGRFFLAELNYMCCASLYNAMHFFLSVSQLLCFSHTRIIKYVFIQQNEKKLVVYPS